MASRMDEHTRLRAGGAYHGLGAPFATKLRPPRAGTGTVTVPRPRLHGALDRGVDAGTVIISAPAGSGKTTLLADWVREQTSRRRVAWVTLGSAERDPVRFAEYARAALDQALADLPHQAPLPAPTSGLVDEPYLAEVARRLSGVPDEVVLVLDDFQRVAGSATERLLKRILRYPVEPVRLVVLSRREPALGQTKLRLRGHLHELGTAHLALTIEETTDLVRQHGLGRLPRTQVEELLYRTAGWATGLRAVLASLQELGELPDDRLVDHALRGARTELGDYLETEVLPHHSPEIVEFVRRTSTVPDVCGELADALTGGHGGAGTLSDLHRDRLFLEPDGLSSDERCTWYRWNPLVAEVVRSQVKDRDPGPSTDLHRVAGQWFHRRGFPAEAVRHTLAAGDVDAAAELLARTWFDLAAAGRTDTLQALLRSFDEERLADRPELLVIEAFLALHDHELTRASAAARRAQEPAPDLPGDRRTTVEVAATAVRLGCAGLTGVVDTAHLYPSALALLDRIDREHRTVTRPDRRRRALLLHEVGSFELSQWRYADAVDHLTEAFGEAASLGMADLLPRIRAQLATVEIFSGRLALARSGAEDVLDAAHHGERADAQAHVVAHLAVAAVDLHRGDADAALASLRLARVALHPADRFNDLRIRLWKHAALLLRHRDHAAAEELDGLRELLTRHDVPTWVTLMTTVAEAHQLRATGEIEPALRALESAAALANDGFLNQTWRNAYAQALLDAGRPAEARAVVAEIVDGGGDRPLEVQSVLLDCLAAEALGLPDESLRSLTRAVRLSRREHILRPFLLRATLVRPLLEAMVEAGTAYEDHVRQIVARLPRPEPADATPPMVEPLTARELEVLEAMRGASTNEQIAAQLFVSLNTLRSHIKQINRKLGVTNRREAVARGRRLGLV